MVRIGAYWISLASQRPANPTNPADPAYDFSTLDATVKAAVAHHLGVILTVDHAPAWAEGNNRPNNVPAGAWKPNPTALGQFAQALAKRYSGHFQGLPRVSYFEAWNEPNLTGWLAPQWKGKRVVSPGLYRSMLNHFYAGVHRSQPGAKVIGGAMAPFGDDPGHPLFPGQPRTRPLVFLRKLFCLNGKLKQAAGCKAKTNLDVLSDHPVNIVNSPNRHARNRDDVEIADFSKLRLVLRAAERAGTVRPAGHRPLWATEMWWLTNPPNPIGISPDTQARWLQQGFYLLWKQGASAAINFEIRDPAFNPNQSAQGQATTGVFFHSGKRKPAYRSFQFPFVGHRESKQRVGIWGKAPGYRHAQGAAKGIRWLAHDRQLEGRRRQGLHRVRAAARQGRPSGEDRHDDQPRLAPGLKSLTLSPDRNR